MTLQPPLLVQIELYKIYSLLVQVVQVASDEFTVVDPHDFIEAWSWKDSIEAGDAEIIRRLRGQTATQSGIKKVLLIPFSNDANVFLAVVNLGAALFRIFDPRTDEVLQSTDEDDGFDTTLFVYEFIHTLFPTECPSMEAWKIELEKTVQRSVSIKQLGVTSGRHLNDFGARLKMQAVLPFFFEALRIVAGANSKPNITDVALLKRLFAIFDDSPELKSSDVIQQLRERSREQIYRSLRGRLRSVLQDNDVDIKKAIAETRWGGCRPGQLVHLKIIASQHACIEVSRSLSKSKHLTEQHVHLRFILETMTAKCLMTRAALYHGMLHNMAAGYFYSVDAHKEIWGPDAALNQWNRLELHSIERKLQAMRTELDHWLKQFQYHLDSANRK